MFLRTPDAKVWLLITLFISEMIMMTTMTMTMTPIGVDHRTQDPHHHLELITATMVLRDDSRALMVRRLGRMAVIMVLSSDGKAPVAHRHLSQMMITMGGDSDRKIRTTSHLGQIIATMDLAHARMILTPLDHLVGKLMFCTVPVSQQKQATPNPPGDQSGRPNNGPNTDRPDSGPKPPRAVDRD
ncbi:hypothetical protein LZ31DRAFT_600721 [Colletotrichum somersetense]|nr:hypothetical protein LZ31DRAFT_600721 [Colletotrichum somersetense]